MRYVSDIPKEASHDVLEKSNRLLLHELVDHVAENCANCVEALVCLTDVRKTDVIEQDLLDDEDGDCLAEL